MNEFQSESGNEARSVAQRTDERYDNQASGERCVSVNQRGEPCEKFAISGTNLCQWHGGRIDKRQFVSESELAEWKPPKKRKINIGGRINEIRKIVGEDQQNLLDSTEEIEILTARFQLLLEQAEELPVLSKKVFEEYDKWKEVRKSANKARFAEQTARLENAIETCRGGVFASGDFIQTADQLRRFKETEMKRRIAMRQMMDAGDAANLMDEACGGSPAGRDRRSRLEASLSSRVPYSVEENLYRHGSQRANQRINPGR
jgi:hypothetical protein